MHARVLIGHCMITSRSPSAEYKLFSPCVHCYEREAVRLSVPGRDPTNTQHRHVSHLSGHGEMRGVDDRPAPMTLGLHCAFAENLDLPGVHLPAQIKLRITPASSPVSFLYSASNAPLCKLLFSSYFASIITCIFLLSHVLFCL